MSNTHTYYCSLASKHHHEAIWATAPHALFFILIEYNDPFPADITQGNLNKKWLEELERFTKGNKGKLLFIRNGATRTDIMRIIYVDCRQKRYFSIEVQKNGLHTIQIDQVIPAITEWYTDSFYMVCTHGKKDKCCAKWGLPVYDQLKDQNSDLQVWQCSHVGGHRFAANVLIMPYGIYYGNIEINDITDIVEHNTKAMIYFEKYRGASIYTPLQQAIEAHFRKEYNNYSIALEFQFGEETWNEKEVTANVTISDYGQSKYILVQKIKTLPYTLSCDATRLEDIITYQINNFTPL